MKKIKVHRNWWSNFQVLGNCTVLSEEGKPLFSSLSMERPWKENKQKISCIPAGDYKVVLEYSDKFKKKLWEIKDVPNRSECKFHAVNYVFQLEGCIGLGEDLVDLNSDGYDDITNSRKTMERFHNAFGDDTEAILEIR